MIDPRAAIDSSAEIDENVKIGPFTVIGPNVRIAAGTDIGPHVVINGETSIGRDNRIYQFASIGEEPQDKKYAGEPTRLEIGERNRIREFTTIHRGTAQDNSLTRIGSDNLLMAYTHVAHDCQIGDHVIMSNAASLGGHVQVDDWAILGGFSIVHQFCRIGAHCFTGMGSAISKDVPPFIMVAGQPAKPRSINSEGLRRRDFSAARITEIKRAFRTLYSAGLPLAAAKEEIAQRAEFSDDLRLISDFLAASERSIVR
jgi:UDP-N-acetylglucosamine acyltransferase